MVGIGSRVFNIVSGAVNLSGLAIVDGNVSSTRSPHLTASLTANDTTTAGGGVLNSGYLTIERSSILSNTAVTGGGIYNNLGTVFIRNSTIAQNEASYGGGYYNDKGTVILDENSISDNTATVTGNDDYNDQGKIILITSHSYLPVIIK